MGFDMNYKIKVESEAKSKEVQELFFELGYGWRGVTPENSIFIPKKLKEYFIINYENTKDMQLSGIFDNSETLTAHKEITLPELRDLVVLKRNSIEDATHTGKHGSLWYLGFNKYGWRFDIGDNGEWELDNPKNKTVYFGELKPIEKKEMKEYLEKQPNGSYVMKSGFALAPADWIEIPEGALYAYDTGSTGFLFTENERINYTGFLVWQRESPNDKLASAEQYRQAEVLPFIDDELHKSREWDLSDYDFAESDAWIESNIEQGLKHSHYKKDVSNLEVVDIYRLTELFKPHSCGAHIAKKALCSGNRGHKDLLTDIQDIIDTAERWKEMLIEDEIFSETEMPF